MKEGKIPPPAIMMEEQGRDTELPAGGGRSELAHGLGLRALGARHDVKLDLLTFIQGTKAPGFNRRVVDEDIRTVVLGDKPIPFSCVKPLYGPLCHGMILLTWGKRMPQRMIGGP